MMFNLIRSLSRRHSLTVLSFYENEAELKRIPELAEYCEKLEVLYRGQTFEVSNLFGTKPIDIIHEFHHSRMARLVNQYLATRQYDVLHCEFLYTAHLAGLCPEIPAILTNHEVLSLSRHQAYEQLRWGQRGKLRALTSWMRVLHYEETVLRNFFGIVVLTEREAQFLRRLLPHVRVFSRPMGVDCDYFQPQLSRAPEKIAVFIGNFRHSPNVSAALWLLNHIWPRILVEVPDAKLHIIGGFPDVRMQAFHQKNNVTITGLVDDVRPFLADSRVVLAPVFEGAGMRTKVLEAWAMQRPVIGTSLSFAGLTADNDQFGYIADTEAEFAHRTVELLNDAVLSETMGQRARHLVQTQFSWDSFADLYDRMYAEALDRRGPQPSPFRARPGVELASAEQLGRNNE
jgi:glycosyltransferase involved in cell wall biosynthesis